MKKKRKMPKSWERQLTWMYGHKKSYRKARHIKSRKRYWIGNLMSWANPGYMTKAEIEKSFHSFVEMRGA